MLIWGLSSAQILEGLQALTGGFQHHRLSLFCSKH